METVAEVGPALVARLIEALSYLAAIFLAGVSLLAGLKVAGWLLGPIDIRLHVTNPPPQAAGDWHGGTLPVLGSTPMPGGTVPGGAGVYPQGRSGADGGEGV